ncbi:MAG: HAMP domain-containing histidine kinase [Pirellulaceae bacterium]|nr:HAMP domain-containing histidine kinase [Pirellulaceae bacterium]
MIAAMPIRKKILLNMIVLSVILLLLTFVSLRVVDAYRALTGNIGALSYEVQELWSLGQDVGELRSYFRRGPLNIVSKNVQPAPDRVELLTLSGDTPGLSLQSSERVSFLNQLHFVEFKLGQHRTRFQNRRDADPLLASSSQELELVNHMLDRLKLVQQWESEYHSGGKIRSLKIAQELDDLALDAHSLFKLLTDRMRTVREEARSTYSTWRVIIIVSGVWMLLIVLFSYWFLRKQVVQPFKILLSGSRRIASGEFDHRIILRSRDELAELADAQNKMTSLFVEIKNNLDQKVRERSQEVVRSEQLASVGFLAAGVAHEINNPLASIAWSAESLESRLHEMLHQDPAQADMDAEELKILGKYLKRIQDEAFRCKGITERLLDFSRLGETQRKQLTNVHDGVSDVVELVRHLGQYRNHRIHFEGVKDLQAWISPTEFKQVVLNLLTNSLDASESGQEVRLRLSCDESQFQLIIEDDGCGMTAEVMSHLFEPFFTRRRDGRGTGLGLSITYRIVQDHEGTLVPESPGPGRGSRFTLTMPIRPSSLRSEHENLQAA